MNNPDTSCIPISIGEISADEDYVDHCSQSSGSFSEYFVSPAYNHSVSSITEDCLEYSFMFLESRGHFLLCVLQSRKWSIEKLAKIKERDGTTWINTYCAQMPPTWSLMYTVVSDMLFKTNNIFNDGICALIFEEMCVISRPHYFPIRVSTRPPDVIAKSPTVGSGL